MDVLLDHRLQTRRPVVVFGVALAAGLLALAGAQGAVWVIWAIWIPAVLALGALFVWFPVSGSRIDGDSWMTFWGRHRRVIALDEIRAVALRRWSDGPDTCRIHLWDGRTLTVPATCLQDGAVLAETLQRAGVTVIRD